MSQQLVEMNVIPVAGRVGRVNVRPGAPLVVTTQAFNWPGIRLEAGHNNITSVDEISGIHHYVSMNLDDRPVTIEVKGQHGFRRIVLRRGSAWLVPAGDVVSTRLNSNFSYIRLSMDPIYFARLASDRDGESVELRRTYNITKSQIGHLLNALVAESDAGNPGGLAFVEALAIGLARQISLHASVEPVKTTQLRGGLSTTAKRRALELMDACFNANLTVDVLASEVGLSPAHFSRAFKESVGRAPHRYLLSLRLERARRMLDDDEAALSEVAQATGFADQAHFTRHFKREFGVTPGTLLKGRRS